MSGIIYDKDSFSYWLKPISVHVDRVANTRRENLFIALVSVGLSSPDGITQEEILNGPFKKIDNHRKPVPLGEALGGAFEPGLYCMDIDQNAERGFIEEHALAYLHFYKQLLISVFTEINKKRLKKCLLTFAEKLSDDTFDSESIGNKVEEHIERLENFKLTNAQRFDNLKQICTDFLSTALPYHDKDKFPVIWKDFLANQKLFGGLVVLSEYAMPSFRGGENEALSRKAIESCLHDIVKGYDVYLFAGTKNDCQQETDDESGDSLDLYGYSYGAFFSPIGREHKIFKKEHAMDGQRRFVLEDFISQPAVPSLSVLRTEIGHMSFPICADFISPTFDQLFNDVIYEQAVDEMHYVFAPARDPSKYTYLNAKLNRPIDEWYRDFTFDGIDSTSIRKNMLSKSSFSIGYVNALDTAVVGASKNLPKGYAGLNEWAENNSDKDPDVLKSMQGALMGYFEVSDFEKKLNDVDHVQIPCEEFMVSQPIVLSELDCEQAVECEPTGLIEKCGDVHDWFSAMLKWEKIRMDSYGAYVSIFETQTRFHQSKRNVDGSSIDI